MSEPTTIENDILQALREHGPLTRVEIQQRCFLDGEATRCGNALNRLKEKRLVERGDHKTWRIAGARTEPKVLGVLRPHDDIQPTRTTPSLAEALQRAPLDRGGIHATLERAAQQAQDVLDEYVWAVGEEKILGPLMASRDAARQALAAYEERT